MSNVSPFESMIYSQLFLRPRVACHNNEDNQRLSHVVPTPFTAQFGDVEMCIFRSCVWNFTSDLDGFDDIFSVQSPRWQSAVQEVVIGVMRLLVDLQLRLY